MKNIKKIMGKNKQWYTPKDLKECILFNYDLQESAWKIYIDDIELTMGRLNKSAKKYVRKIAAKLITSDSKYRLQFFERLYDEFEGFN